MKFPMNNNPHQNHNTPPEDPSDDPIETVLRIGVNFVPSAMLKASDRVRYLGWTEYADIRTAENAKAAEDVLRRA